MYAIRSYYERHHQHGTQDGAESYCRGRGDRITSYNVCYTKLLRSVQQADIGQCLGEAPVNRKRAGCHLAPVIHDLQHPWMQLEPRRQPLQPAGKSVQLFQRHAGVTGFVPVMANV